MLLLLSDKFELPCNTSCTCRSHVSRDYCRLNHSQSWFQTRGASALHPETSFRRSASCKVLKNNPGSILPQGPAARKRTQCRCPPSRRGWLGSEAVCGPGGGAGMVLEQDALIQSRSMRSKCNGRAGCWSGARPQLLEWSISLNLDINLDQVWENILIFEEPWFMSWCPLIT